MNAWLMELIDVSTIETMAEQFYQLTTYHINFLMLKKNVYFHLE